MVICRPTGQRNDNLSAAIAAALSPQHHCKETDTQALDLIAHHPDATDQKRAAAQWHLMLGQAERVLGA